MKKLLAVALVGASLLAAPAAEARDRDRNHDDFGRNHGNYQKNYDHDRYNNNGRHYGHNKHWKKKHYMPHKVVYRTRYVEPPRRVAYYYDDYYYPSSSIYLGFNF